MLKNGHEAVRNVGRSDNLHDVYDERSETCANHVHDTVILRSRSRFKNERTTVVSIKPLRVAKRFLSIKIIKLKSCVGQR